MSEYHFSLIRIDPIWIQIDSEQQSKDYQCCEIKWHHSLTAGAAPTEFGSIVREPKAEVAAAWRIRDVIMDANAMLVLPRWIVVIIKVATILPELRRKRKIVDQGIYSSTTTYYPGKKKTATTIMHKIRTLFLSWDIKKSSLIAPRCAAMREVAASRANVPISWSCWYCVIRTVFWFYA